MKKTIIILVAATFLTSSAQAQDASERYHELYGDGLRLYAEGRYDRALQKLYRAWAVEQSDLLLKLIIRSHDFMGHCSAANRQIGLFDELYARQTPPKLQRCDNPGTLAVECTPHAGEVVINHQIHIACGTQVLLPQGRHRIHSAQLNEEQFFEVLPGQTTIARLKLTPEKWERPRARRSEDSDSILIQTPAGRYRIWLESNLRRDPDMDRESPGFELLEDKPPKKRLEIPSISP